MYLNNNNYNSPNSTVEAFAQNFASVYENFNNSNIDSNSVINVLSTPLTSCSISLIEVFYALKLLLLSNFSWCINKFWNLLTIFSHAPKIEHSITRWILIFFVGFFWLWI